MQGGMVSNRLQRDMNPRDAVITFQFLLPDVVRVIEMIGDKSIRHREVQWCPNVMAELEERYIFFAKQADVAKRRLRLGQSAVFNVYFREP